ncbi:MAG TPA: cation diffusion facilitator family transporter [Anaerolineales bacterium]
MENSGDVRSLKIAMGAYVLVLALKLVVYFMSGVMALLAEALHTLSDIFVSGFLLAAAYYSRRAPDREHMFGYGRAQNIAALVAATLFISFTSYKLYEESIPRLFKPGETEYQNLWLAIGAILISMVIAAIPLVQLYLQKSRGAAAQAQLMESTNDELGLVAALIGTLFIMWGKPLADPLASIAVATIIAYNGVKLFRENWSLLLGRSPGQAYLQGVRKSALSVPGVLGVHDLRAEYIGPDVVHAGMHIEVKRRTPIEAADRISQQVHDRVHEAADMGFCVIHVDPASSGRGRKAARQSRR